MGLRDALVNVLGHAGIRVEMKVKKAACLVGRDGKVKTHSLHRHVKVRKLPVALLEKLSANRRYALAIALLLLSASPGSGAQSYPNRAVRVIVPYSPGANADLIARIVAQRVAPVWGQQVVLDNRPGGATNIGSVLAAKSPPDGYTLLLAGPPNVINVSLMAKLPYDFMADFTPIVLGTRVPNVLSVHPSLPARTLAELIALARSRPGQLSFASGGLGSANQMAGELLKINAKINIVHVPYKGSAPAIIDTVGGHVELLFAGISSLVPHIKSGRLRPLATGSTKRLPVIPDVATFIELGYPEMTTSVWFGFMAPAATPRNIVAKLNADLDAVLTRRDVREQLITDGQEPGGGTSEEFDAFLRGELAKYAKVIKLAGIRME